MSPFDVLTIVFIVLKLIGVITWSWWLVFAPTLGGLVLWVLLIMGILLFSKGGKRPLSRQFR